MNPLARLVEGREGDIWIFGYGSLMWNPGFAHLEARPALLRGYHRAFCVYSHRYRGTPERPGLVLGLDRGGACRGMAFRIDPGQWGPALDYLHDREMLHNVYNPKVLDVVLLPERSAVPALAFVVDRRHAQYTGKLPIERTVELILQGVGGRGPCRDYLANTVRHLEELGIDDGPLHDLLDACDRACSDRAAPADRPLNRASG